MPRTSPTNGCFSLSSSSFSRKWAPTTRALVRRSSSSITCNVANAAVIDTGLPPNVANVAPGNLSATSGVVIVNATGVPLPMPLALVITSGSTSQCSMPNHLSPVRPQAVCTSSAMNSPPYLRTIAAARSK